MNKVITILIVLAASSCYGQNPVTFKNHKALPVPRGYSQSATIDLGNSTMIMMSGQIALDKDGKLVGKDDLAAQVRQIFLNIKAIVDDHGGSMSDVVKLNYFMKDISKVQVLRDVRDEFVNIKNPPVSTLVEISRLVRDDLLIEIEATAVVPKK